MPNNRNRNNSIQKITIKIERLYFDRRYYDVLKIYDECLKNNTLTDYILSMALNSCLYLKTTVALCSETQEDRVAGEKKYQEKAMEIYDVAIKNKILSLQIANLAMEISYDSSHLSKIFEIFKKIEGLNLLDYESVHRVILAYSKIGMYNKVIEIFKKYSRRFPEIVDRETSANIIEAFYKEKKYEEGIQAFNSMNRLVKKSDILRTYVSFMYSLLGKYEEALALSPDEPYIKGLKRYKDSLENGEEAVDAESIRSFMYIGNYDKVIELYMKLLEKNSYDLNAIDRNILRYVINSYSAKNNIAEINAILSGLKGGQEVDGGIFLESLKAYYKEKKYKNIIETYSVIKERDVVLASAEHLSYIIKAHYQLGNYKEILKILEDPTNLASTYFLENINCKFKTLNKLGKYKEVAKASQESTKKDITTTSEIIFANNKLGEYGESIALFRRFFESIQAFEKDNNEVLFNIIESFYKIGDYISASCIFDTILSMGTNITIDNVDSLSYAFLANYKIGNFEKAEKIYREYFIDLKNPEIVDALIDILYKQNDYEEILKISKITQYANETLNTHSNLLIMRSSYKSGDFKKAKEIYDKIENLADESIYNDSIIINGHLKNDEKLLSIYQKMQKDKANTPEISYNMMEYYMRKNDYKNAESFYSKLKNSKTAEKIENLYLYGIEIYNNLKNYNEVINIYTKFLPSNKKTNINACERIIKAYSNTKQYSKVVAIYNNISDKSSITLEYFKEIINAIKKVENKQKLLQEYIEIISLKKADNVILSETINLSFELKNYKNIISIYENNKELFLNNKNNINCLIQSYFELGKDDEALEIYNKTNDKVNANTLNYVIKADYLTSNYQDIIKLYKQNNSLFTRNKEFTNYLFDSYQKLDMSQNILETCQDDKSIIEKLNNQNLLYFINIFKGKSNLLFEENSNNLTESSKELLSKITSKILSLNVNNKEIITDIFNINYSLQEYDNVIKIFNSSKINDKQLIVKAMDSACKLEKYQDLVKIYDNSKDILFNSKNYNNFSEFAEVEKQNPTALKEKDNTLSDLISTIVKINFAENNFEKVLEVYNTASKNNIYSNEIFNIALKSIKNTDNSYNKILDLYNKAVVSDEIDSGIIFETMKSSLENEKYSNLEKIYKHAFNNKYSNEKMSLFMLNYYSESLQNEKFLKEYKLAKLYGYDLSNFEIITPNYTYLIMAEGAKIDKSKKYHIRSLSN